MLNKRVLLYAIGLGALVANSISLYITFLWAYFINDMVFATNINCYGEAQLEMIVIPITMIVGFWSIFDIFKNKVKYENKTVRSADL